MKSPISTLAAGAAVLLLSAAPDLAAQGAPPAPANDSLPTYVLEAVTVSARRTPALRSDVPQKVEVVTSSDLERTVGDGVADALKEAGGLDVIQFPGLLAGVSIRGFRPQFSGIGARTLILLDGRPAGVTNLATLDMSQIERIEILKGPASALYGSSAMGGAVNLITRSSRGPVTGRATGSFGTFGEYRGDLAMGGTLGSAVDFDLTLARAGRAGGYDVGRNRLLGDGTVVKHLQDGGTMTLTEIDPDSTITFSDYDTRSASLRVGREVGAGWRVEARAAYFSGDDIENPGDLIAGWGQTLNDLERRTAEASVSGVVGSHALSARAYGSRESALYYDDPVEPAFVSFRSPVTWRGAQVMDVISLGANSLTAGLDYGAARSESERFVAAGVEAPPFAPDSEIRSTAGFAEARAEWLAGRLVTTVGARLDRVTMEVEEGAIWDFGTWSEAAVAASSETHHVFNPSAGLLYVLGAGVRTHASAGRAFVTPDPFFVAGYSEVRLSDRRAVAITRGNPDLNPESSVSWDAGVSLSRPGMGIEADLTYFSTEVRDRIVATPVPLETEQLTPAGDTVIALTSYANADEAEIRGLEGRVSYDLGARAGYRYSLRLFATGTRLLRAVEVTAGESGRIRNVADLTVVGGIDYDDRRRVAARLSGRYVGHRMDTDFVDWMNPGDIRYPQFLVLDAAARLRLPRGLSLSLGVDNLTDENYYEVRGYNLPGRSVRLGAAVGF